MAILKINGDTSGSVSLTVPATAGTNTATIPASTGNVLLDSTVGVCRAWVNFNGTGTVAIRASFNVSSITDNGTGDYTVNFTNALSDANFAVAGAASGGSAGAVNNAIIVSQNITQTSSSARVYCLISSSATAYDSANYSIAIFR